MTETADVARRAPSMKQGKLVVQPGQPLQFVDVVDSETRNVAAMVVHATVGETLKAYRDAARTLLEGKYAGQKELAPPHMREPCNVFVIRCRDGMLVRYDLALEGSPK